MATEPMRRHTLSPLFRAYLVVLMLATCLAAGLVFAAALAWLEAP